MRQERDNDIMAFDDARSYLRAVLAGKTGNKLGVRALARRAGIRSASSLTMVSSGQRRLTPALAEKLSAALSLEGKRKSYLLALSRIDCAATPQEAALARESATFIRNHDEQQLLRLPQYRFLASWHYPAIYELAATQGFRMDAKWIAKRLRGAVSLEDVRRAIGDMINLGLFVLQNGKLSRTNSALATSDDVASVAIQRYHSEMLARAQDAMALGLEERDYSGLTVAIAKRQVGEVKAMIRRFRKELNELLSAEASAEEVYQLNFQFFPLTWKNGEDHD